MSTDFPLDGVRVLDLSRVLAGPVCCQLLADLGADVVKLERPGTGDDTRHWGPPFLGGDSPDDGPSAYFLSCNRGKRSLALDLSAPGSREVLVDLIRRADVLVENFLPATLEKFGLLPDQLRQINPRLVSCSISGYGRTGPDAKVPGYDLNIQATHGIMSITGEPGGRPMKIGVAMADVITGLYAATSVLAGLHARDQGRIPPAFDLALADCTLASLVNVAQGALLTGQRPKRYGNAHPHIVPYEEFATADGHLVVAVGNDRQWLRFCAATGRADLAADARFMTNPLRVEHREILIPQLQQTFRERTTAEWLAALLAADVPHAPVLALDEVLATPQVAARQMVLDAKDSARRPYRLLGSAVHWHDEPPRTPHPPPALGQHTHDVLRDWLAYDAEQIDSLRAANVIV
jgi:crotonobetainyl-CoA:carnitine CoA-transferase CaiB-like acyl-CoA transferase